MTGELPSSEVPSKSNAASRTGPSPERLAVCIPSDCAVMCARLRPKPSRAAHPSARYSLFDTVFLELRIIQFSIRAAKGQKFLMRALLDNVTVL